MAYVEGHGHFDTSAGTAYGYKTSTDYGANYGLMGNIIGGLTGSNKAAEDAASAYNSSISNKFNADEAQKERDWSEYMASTSYQRAFADAKAAGINPYYIVGNGSGASSGSSSAASSSGSPSFSNKRSNKTGLAATALAIAKIAALLVA